MPARLGEARIPLQVDIGFGDVITPGPVEVEYPTFLDFPAPKLKSYPKETVVAEKLEAMVKLGIANSRMKDFYDLLELSRRFNFEGSLLKSAIQATFQRRGTAVPSTTPLALTPEFYEAPQKQMQWTAFLRKSGLAAPSLDKVIISLQMFLLPLIVSIQRSATFDLKWSAGGQWG